MCKSILFVLSLLCATQAMAQTLILAIGDSLTAGLGVPVDKAYPALVEEKLQKKGVKGIKIVNAGTSGATTASGTRTLQFHLKRQKPDIVLLALGANDALRGLNPANTKDQLASTIELAQKEKIRIMLLGMKAPPNYGRKFPRTFEKIYPELAKKYNVPLLPFMLEGVAGDKQLNQADGIHPNEAGYEVIADHVADFVMENL